MGRHKKNRNIQKINDNTNNEVIENEIFDNDDETVETKTETFETKKIKKLTQQDYERINEADKRHRKPVLRVLNNPAKNKFLWGGGNGLKPAALYTRILKAYYQKKHIYLTRVEAIKIYKLDQFKKRKMRSFYLHSWWIGVPYDFYEFVVNAFEQVRKINE